MTQSYNLSQLANNLNTAGQLDATDGLIGAVPPANGGTGLASYAVGDLLYASGATAIAKLPDIATGNVLISGGVSAAPSYGKVGLTTHVTGTLGLANGGTNSTSTPVAGSVIVGTGTAMAATAAGTSGQVLVSQGAGAPIWSSAPSAGPRAQYFTSTGSNTFTIPAGTTSIKVTIVSAGGGGGGQLVDGGTNPPGGAGGAGRWAAQWFVGLTPGNTLTVTVGAAGTGGASSTNGGTGGTTSLASGTQTITTIQATGGTGGISGGGAGTNGTVTGSSNGGSGAAGYYGPAISSNAINSLSITGTICGLPGTGGVSGAGTAGTQGAVLIEY